jgi:glyoxylase-like metal-dependent hydrolase (beta-lactamase superfamily II)
VPSPILIPAGNASEWTGPTGNNTWLLTGRVPTLVDAGVGNAGHLDAVARHLAGRPLALLLITHGHVDHVSGAPRVVERWPGAIVRGLATGQVLGPDERVDAGDTVLRVVATPGHAPDHCCFLDDTTRELYCGDLARAGGTVVIPARRGGDLGAYLASLRAVRALRPSRLLPGHGPIVEDADNLIEAYLRHRAERDRQILGVLAEGEHTAEETAARIYRGLPPALEKAAIETVRAHLLRLQQLGRVVARGDAWIQAG